MLFTPGKLSYQHTTGSLCLLEYIRELCLSQTELNTIEILILYYILLELVPTLWVGISKKWAPHLSKELILVPSVLLLRCEQLNVKHRPSENSRQSVSCPWTCPSVPRSLPLLTPAIKLHLFIFCPLNCQVEVCRNAYYPIL
jgi:hypothetical protein